MFDDDHFLGSSDTCNYLTSLGLCAWYVLTLWQNLRICECGLVTVTSVSIVIRVIIILGLVIFFLDLALDLQGLETWVNRIEATLQSRSLSPSLSLQQLQDLLKEHQVSECLI